MSTAATGRHIDIFSDTDSLPIPIQQEVRQIVQANYEDADSRNISEDMSRLGELLSWNSHSSKSDQS